MGFKSLIVVAALTLLSSITPIPVANGLSVANHGGQLVSRERHSDLIARQSRGKRCPARAGTSTSTPPKSTPKPTSTKPPATNIGGTPNPQPASYKAGVPFSDFLAGTERRIGHKVAFTYNWGVRKPYGHSNLTNFIPMLHSRGDEGTFKSVVQAGYAKEALSVNEPDHPAQANMSPGEAAGIWRRAFVPLKSKGYRVYSPSATSSDRGTDWLRRYFDACDCLYQTDAIAAHFYMNSASRAKTYLTNLHNEFKRPIIVTEFACANYATGDRYAGCGADGAYNFAREITQWMDDQPWILKYAHFGFWVNDGTHNGIPGANALYNRDGSFTRLGNSYFHR